MARHTVTTMVWVLWGACLNSCRSGIGASIPHAELCQSYLMDEPPGHSGNAVKGDCGAAEQLAGSDGLVAWC